MPPQKIGRYEVISELGRGGMATVFRAHDPSFDREVAVKVLPREFLHDPQFLVRFQREIKTIAQLEHPAIVPVYDVGEDEGQPFFVMRNMTGGSLSDWLKQGAFSLQDTARIIERLAKGLAYAHKKGIVHRDLKPGNVLFDNNGEAFISDFGVAKLADAASSVTGSGIVGTPAYMSPEQVQSGQIDGRSDVYALGAIIYEMLTGEQPYKADTPMGVVIKHVTEPVPEIMRDHPDIPPEVDEVIKKAMSKNRDERYATTIELARALHKAAFGEEGNITDPQYTRPITYPPADTNAKKKSSLLWVIGAVILVVLLAGGFILLNGGQLPGQAEPTATAAPLPTSTPVPSPTATLPPTEAPVVVVPTATVTAIPTPVGGSNQLAFILKSEIWVMNTDGSDSYPVTNDAAPKANLQWTPDGKAVIYVSRMCAYRFDLEARQKEQIACFEGAEAMDGFRLSPDGKRVAISLGRELFIVPFDAAALKSARIREGLVKMQDACLYNLVAVKDMRWSDDGKSLAVIFRDPTAYDAIRVMDVSHCPPSDPVRRDDFPTGRFTVNGYKNSPILPSVDWDGAARFLFTDVIRLEGFGNLYLYDMKTQQGSKINPIEGACCYRDVRWSPDGTHVLLLFQDLRLGNEIHNLLYYAPVDALTTGKFGDPIPIPFDLQTDPAAAPQFEFRPVQ
jgi:serine/threonine protein kinase